MTTWTAKAFRPNEANFPIRPQGAHADTDASGLAAAVHRAKRSQFALRAQKWARGDNVTDRVALRSIVRNKANCQRARGNASALERKSYVELERQRAVAKQSQLPCLAGRGTSRHGGKRICRWGPLRQTKPIPPRPKGKGRGPARLPAKLPRGQSCETKPKSRSSVVSSR
jgi:hypothetical protein